MSKKYAIGVQLVEYVEMNIDEFCAKYGRNITSSEKAGYCVKSDDNNMNYKWYPKSQFELKYFAIANGESNRITDEDALNFADLMTHDRLDDKTSIVKPESLTGFTFYEVSQCVDPKNYDHDLGLSIATKKILKKITGHLGFVLQWARFGLKKTTDDDCDCLTKCDVCACSKSDLIATSSTISEMMLGILKSNIGRTSSYS